jgi:hypothetical protein
MPMLTCHCYMDRLGVVFRFQMYVASRHVTFSSVPCSNRRWTRSASEGSVLSDALVHSVLADLAVMLLLLVTKEDPK